MSTMGSVLFSVIVLVTIQNAFGNVCLEDFKNFNNCNECIRCGGNWCNEQGVTHCQSLLTDGWCEGNREWLPNIDEVNTPGKTINPIYAERTLFVDNPNRLDIQFPAGTKSKPMAKIVIMNSTQNFNIEVKKVSEPKCVDMNCTMTIEAMPQNDFCSATSRTSEFAYVKINLGLAEEVLVKYHVPCACECTQKVDRKSKFCNYNGDFSCGICSCYSGWTGDFCKEVNCPAKRGDVRECSPELKNDADCNNNGYCGPCETCICYTDRERSRYFDPQNKCADLCMVTGNCEDCLLNSTIGKHTSDDGEIFTFVNLNDSLTNKRDEYNRKIWVSCNETIDDCYIEYYAKKTDNGEIYVMVKNHCNFVNTQAIVGQPNVSIILGVLGIIAAVAAVGGVMLWKHLNTVPPVPLNDPQYQNIDAEDCTGENPLYKPPTSSFKNPTYGKW